MNTMFPDTFDTARLVLRPVALADARPIFDGYAQDPEVTRFLTWRPHRRVEDTEAYISNCLAAAFSRTYVLITRSGEKLIGALDLRQSSPWRLGCGYVLAQSSWGQGLMTEALKTVADWAINQPEIWRIGDFCDVENLASARVMEKAGFSQEGVLIRWSMHPNVSDQPRDCFSFARAKTASVGN
jgi:ribosomal-protein-alanine N-acetyltransferase